MSTFCGLAVLAGVCFFVVLAVVISLSTLRGFF